MANSTGVFGKFEETFNKEIGTHEGLIKSLLVFRSTVDNKTKFTMSFETMRGMTMTVDFEYNPDGRRTDTTIQWFSDKSEKWEATPILNTPDNLCSMWLYHVLCNKNYKYEEVSLDLPAGHNVLGGPPAQIQIKKLNITIRSGEQNRDIVHAWLEKFENGVEDMVITSVETTIDLTTNQCLQKSKGFEIFGKVVFDTELIESLHGKYFIHKPEQGAYTDLTYEQLRDLGEHCLNLGGIKAISLEMRDESFGQRLSTWLESAEGSKNLFYVNVDGRKVQFGRFETEEQARTDSYHWRNMF